MQQYEIIYKAGAYWHDTDLDKFDYILLLPRNDEVLNNRIREAFEEKLGGSTGVIICNEAAQQLNALYSLYRFSEKIIIGSFIEPHGRKLRNLLDAGIATEYELIKDVILGGMDETVT